jgi:hypothetical protein
VGSFVVWVEKKGIKTWGFFSISFYNQSYNKKFVNFFEYSKLRQFMRRCFNQIPKFGLIKEISKMYCTYLDLRKSIILWNNLTKLIEGK